MRVTYLYKSIKSQRALLRNEDTKQLIYVDINQLEGICPFFSVGDSGTMTTLHTGRHKIILDTIECVPMIEHKQEEINEQYSLQNGEQ
jgi:hypothetical protein